MPANGRGPEIALELMRHGVDEIYVDDATRKRCDQLGDSDRVSLRAGLRDEIERLAHVVKPIDGARGVMLAASADGASGATAKLLPEFESQPEVTILFTGYVNPDTPAERLDQKRSRANHALERAPSPRRHRCAGEVGAGEDGDPRLLRPRLACGARRRARAGARDDGRTDRDLVIWPDARPSIYAVLA